MRTIEKCCFCEVGNGAYANPVIDIPYASDDKYFALASVGAMVEGWSLVIPRAHGVSLKSNYAGKELQSFLDTLLPKLIGQYGRVVAFEHGANMEGSLTGCGTNHAHLHLVPLAESLSTEMKQSGLLWENCKPSEIARKVGGSEYLFYKGLQNSATWDDSTGQLHVLQSPQSQFFRKMIAKKLGIPNDYDYKKYPNLAIASKTQKVLAAL